MRFCWPLAVVLAGCYGPTVHPGAPCGPSGECPSNLECISGMCLPPGTLLDDAQSLDDASIDSSMVTFDAPADADPSYVPWGMPIEIPSLNAISGMSEDDPSFTLNRLTVIETSSSPEDLYECIRPAIGQAFACTAIAALNSAMAEVSPEISPDGVTLYFVSNRAGTDDVYTSTKGVGGWAAPTLVTQLSTTGSNEGDVAIAPDGLLAVVEHGGHFGFHTRASTALPFGAGTDHNELAVAANIAAPSITNGGAIIYFHAGTTRDLYVARRMGNGNYTTPSPVTELNTAGRDAAPFVSADDKYMMFERDGDIFETSRP